MGGNVLLNLTLTLTVPVRREKETICVLCGKQLFLSTPFLSFFFLYQVYVFLHRRGSVCDRF